MIFWAITFVICGIIAVVFYLSLIMKAPEITSNSDLEVYKDQLINLDMLNPINMPYPMSPVTNEF